MVIFHSYVSLPEGKETIIQRSFLQNPTRKQDHLADLAKSTCEHFARLSGA